MAKAFLRQTLPLAALATLLSAPSPTAARALLDGELALQPRSCAVDADRRGGQPWAAFEFTAATDGTYVFDACDSPADTFLRVMSLPDDAEADACSPAQGADVFQCVDCGPACSPASKAETFLATGSYAILLENLLGAAPEPSDGASVSVAFKGASEAPAPLAEPGSSRRSLAAFDCDRYETNTDGLFPFGRCVNGSTFLPTADDSGVEADISISFPFFAESFDTLWVNHNGIFSFTNIFTSFTPQPFPFSNGFPLIAPFWNDVDIRRNGEISYREILDAATLDRADSLLRSSSFVLPAGYFSTWGFLATWDEVTFFGGSTTTPRNTYQGLLLSDGTRSFAVFIYESLTWSAGVASGGNALGLGGTPARAGFDAGDGVRFFVIPTDPSDADNVVNIDERSNIGIEGIFAFRTDAATIANATCNANSSVALSPMLGTAIGGEVLSLQVSDACFTPALDATCTYRTAEGEGLGSNAALFVDETSVSCSLPNLGFVGAVEVSVAVSRDEGALGHIVLAQIYFATSSVLNSNTRPAKTTAGGRIINEAGPSVMSNETATLAWDPTDIDDDDGATSSGVAIYYACFTDEFQFAVRLTTGAPNSGEFIFDADIILALAPEDASDILVCAGEIQAAPAASGGGGAPVAISAIPQVSRAVAVLPIPPTIFVSVAAAAVLFSFFAGPSECDPFSPNFFEGLPRCPCSETDIDATWEIDDACHEDRAVGQFCLFHQGANNCYRKQTPGAQTRNQCCYAEGTGRRNGELITDWQSGAGSADCRSGLISHFWYDVAPTFLVSPEVYAFYRPSVSEVCTPPPPVGGGFGDPHFTTTDGLGYTFNGCGDFVYARGSSSTCDLEVHARMTPVEGGGSGASVISGLSFKSGASALPLQLTLRAGRVQVIYDGGEVDAVNEEVPIPLGPFLVGRQSEADGGGVSVALADCFSASITMNGATALRASLNPDMGFRGSMQGLLGNFDGAPGNDLMARGGGAVAADASSETIYNDFGLSWEVQGSDERLFTAAPGLCTGFSPTFLDLDDVAASAPSAIVDLCDGNFACLFDFAITGDAAFAAVTLEASGALTVAQAAAAEPVPASCPLLAPLPNGSYAIGSLFVGGTANLTCFPGFVPSGSDTAVCTAGGTYEPLSLGPCVPDTPAPSATPTPLFDAPGAEPSGPPNASPSAAPTPQTSDVPSLGPSAPPIASPGASPTPQMSDEPSALFGPSAAPSRFGASMAPSFSPTTEPLLPLVCDAGVLSSCGNVCCAATCGVCGGCDCGARPGGADDCCPSAILGNGIPCLSQSDVACVADPSIICPANGTGCDRGE